MSELARVTSMDQLVAVFRDRRQALGLSQHDLDAAADLATGHVGRIEGGLVSPGKAYTKRLGCTSLPRLLAALGLELAVVPVSDDDRIIALHRHAN